MSKTPDEIVKALKCCGANLPCDYCPYFDERACDCMSSLNNAAAALIDSLQSQLAETKRQLDAAVKMVGKWPVTIGDTFCGAKIIGANFPNETVTLLWREPQDEKGDVK